MVVGEHLAFTDLDNVQGNYDSLGTLGVSMVQSLFTARAIPVYTVTLEHGGREVTIPAGFDTGASPVGLVIPTALARELGLKAMGATIVNTAGGPIFATRSKIDRVTVNELPGCVATNLDAQYNDNIDVALVGEGFLKAVGATLQYLPDAIRFTCKGSEKSIFVPYGKPIPPRPVPARIAPAVQPVLAVILAAAMVVGLVYLFSSFSPRN